MSTGRNRLPRVGMKPSKVNGLLTDRTEFYRRELFRIIKGMFTIECPDDWNKDYVLNTLIHTGYIAVSNSFAGVLPFYCTFIGYNYTRFPVDVRVVIPQSHGREFDFTSHLGEDAELIYLNWEGDMRFWNFREIVDVFAQRLASCDAGIDVNIMNSRLAYVGEAETKAQAEAIKTAFDKVSEGEPLIVYRSDSLATQHLQLFFNNAKNNYIADLLQDTKRSIMNEFLTLIGINNANTDKKERLVTNEVEANDEEIGINAEEMCRNLCDCCKRVKSTLGVDLRIDLVYSRLSREEQQEEEMQQQMKLAQQSTRVDQKGAQNDSKRNS